jgi:hypothetical protein
MLHCGRITHHNSFLNSHQLPIALTMTAFLQKLKVALLELMKAIPDAPGTDNEDYTMWG